VVHWIVGNRDTDVNRGVRGFADPSAMGHEDPPTLPLEILQVMTDLLKFHVDFFFYTLLKIKVVLFGIYGSMKKL